MIQKLRRAGQAYSGTTDATRTERGIHTAGNGDVDHVTVYPWVQRFTPEFIEAARLCRHAPADRWFAGETYVKVAGRWTYLYRAIDQHGQIIDVMLSHGATWPRPRGSSSGRCARARSRPRSPPTGPPLSRVLYELIPSALNTVERYANNPIETDHGRLKGWLRPMRGLKRRRYARIIATGPAFVQSLRRGHYELATDVPDHHRNRRAFDQLAVTIWPPDDSRQRAVSCAPISQRNTAALSTVRPDWG